VAEALADLAKGPFLEEVRAQCAVVQPSVVAIVAQMPVLPESQDRINVCANDILEAYVNGRWEMRREIEVRAAEAELVTLGARVKVLLADIAGLSDATRQLLDRDLAIRARRLSYLWSEKDWDLEDGSSRLGLGRSCTELELLSESLRVWTAPLDGEDRRGRPDDHAADYVASTALEAYESLTGRRVNRSFQENRGSAEFIDFLQLIFAFFGIDQRAQHRARKALDLRRNS
jgi:hypothetical protein